MCANVTCLADVVDATKHLLADIELEGLKSGEFEQTAARGYLPCIEQIDDLHPFL